MLDLRLLSGPEEDWSARFADDRGSLVTGPTRAAALGRLVRRYRGRFDGLGDVIGASDEVLGRLLVERRKQWGVNSILVQATDLARMRLFRPDDPFDFEWSLPPRDRSAGA